LVALGDTTPHDERYERLIEYVAVMKSLLADQGPVTHEGKHYRVRNLRMAPGLPRELIPDILVSGSSEAGEAAALTMGAISVTYPEPLNDDTQSAPADGRRRGVRVGIIARETADEAWEIAYERFPDTRAGRITHGLAMTVSDSQWHKQLSSLDERPATPDHPYWLGPFQTSATFCPYLVGTYDRVADELARYVEHGASVFILDVPPSREELVHTGISIRRAQTIARNTHAHASS
jgi:alkanesulfonate monooxygenase